MGIDLVDLLRMGMQFLAIALPISTTIGICAWKLQGRLTGIEGCLERMDAQLQLTTTNQAEHAKDCDVHRIELEHKVKALQKETDEQKNDIKVLQHNNENRDCS